MRELRTDEPDALLVHWRNFGTDRVSGGAYERRFLWLATFGAGEHGILEVAHMFGKLDASGGDFESVYVRLIVLRDDRFAGFEPFEVEDLDAARARFEVLRPE